MTTTAPITAVQLTKLGACHEHLARFRKLFGSRVEPTLELCVQHAASFDWDWAATHLLTATAYAEYRKVTATAYAEYDKVTATAWAEYQKVEATAWAAYDKVTATALAAYEKVKAPAFYHAWANGGAL